MSRIVVKNQLCDVEKSFLRTKKTLYVYLKACNFAFQEKHNFVDILSLNSFEEFILVDFWSFGEIYFADLKSFQSLLKLTFKILELF